MTKVTFISKETQNGAVKGIACVDGKPCGFLASSMLEVMKMKPYDAVVEMFLGIHQAQQRCLVVRLDAQSNRKKCEEAGAALYKKFLEGTEKRLVIDIRHIPDEGCDLLAGLLLASWRFDKYRTQLKPAEQGGLDQIDVVCHRPKEMQRKFARQHATIEGVVYARSLTSEPPNVLSPVTYAETFRELEQYGVKVEVLLEADLRRAGMEALLAVGKGSQNKSAVVIMTWNGFKQKTPPVVFVGKGICFDSGGLCLKKPQNQLDMKWDKAGAGVVAGLIKALALQKAAVHAVGVIGLAENMPDGNATRPGDIVRTKSGQTVEIADTDAEGRLVLADCLWYAKERFKPSAMIDLGTLTIETIACLGNRYGGLYSSCAKLAASLKEAGRVSGDEVWELPMGEFFAKQIESSVADMKNIGSELCGENGAAAEFLRRFVGDVPWAHLDIAGVSWTREDLPLASRGVIGFGVRLLEEWVTSRSL